LGSSNYFVDVLVVKFRKFVQSNVFMYAIDAIVAINALLIVIDFYLGEFNELNRQSILFVEIIFTSIFLLGKNSLMCVCVDRTTLTIKNNVELFCKLFALGPRGYWQDLWNRFDFLIVSASLLDIM
jgi:hypothetical protein